MKVTTDNFISEYHQVTKKIIQIEKHQEVTSDIVVQDVFYGMWELGYTSENVDLTVLWEGQTIKIKGKGFILVPPNSLVEWSLGGKHLHFNGLMIREPWPFTTGRSFSFVTTEKLTADEAELCTSLFSKSDFTDENQFRDDLFAAARIVMANGEVIHEDREAIALKVRQRIDQTIKGGFSLDKISEEANLSKSYIIRAFRKFYKLTPGQYAQRLKVYASMFSMLFDKTSTSEAAFESGFESLGHYYGYFKTKIGVTPSQYVKPARTEK